MNPGEEAERFLADYRAALDVPPAGPVSAAALRELGESLVLGLPERARTPQVAAAASRVAGQIAGGGVDGVEFTEHTLWQDHIAQVAARGLPDLRVPPRPLIRLVRTGQLNAVSIAVPDSAEHLIMLEDQLIGFAYGLSHAIAWTIPLWSAGRDGTLVVADALRDMAQRIDTHPEIIERFTNVVIGYVVIGRVSFDLGVPVSPEHNLLGSVYYAAFLYFVLGHVLLGHLDSADQDALSDEPSWQREFSADLLGMSLSIRALVEHQNFEFWRAFLGVGLFLDGLDLMDRAVALLRTGDEHALRLGFHPPGRSRKQRVREFLSTSAAIVPPAAAALVDPALTMDEFQGGVIRLLWARARPILLELRRRGVPVAPSWRTMPTEATG